MPPPPRARIRKRIRGARRKLRAILGPAGNSLHLHYPLRGRWGVLRGVLEARARALRSRRKLKRAARRVGLKASLDRKAGRRRTKKSMNPVKGGMNPVKGGRMLKMMQYR